MLLNTIVKTVKRKSHRGSQSVTSDQITTDIVACINEAIRDVAKLVPKRYWFKQGTGIALTAGTIGTAAVYSMASDVQEIIQLHYTSGSSLTRLQKIDSDKEWIDKVWDPAGALGKPRYYRELGPATSTFYKQIEIYPIPDASYTLNNEYYKNKPTDLTTADLASEVTSVPDSVQDALEKGALYYFLKGFDDSLQMVAKKDYEDAKLEMEIADERDMDSDLRMRFNMMGRSNPQGFSR